MYQIEGTYQVEDYQQANRLHMRQKWLRNTFIRLVFYGILFCIFVFVGIGIYMSLDYQSSLSILATILPIILILVLLGYVYLPYRTKKIFAQQKELHLPLKMEISEEGIRFENANSQGMRTWDIFIKWKENQNILMLYLSDLMFMMLPTRMVGQEALGFVRQQLKKNNIPEK